MAEEPWLRGPIEGVDALVSPTLHALRQVREDLEKSTADLTDEQMWMRPHGLAPLGFHLRHMAGSLDRLTSYLDGRELTASQFAFLRAEAESGAGREELVRGVLEAIGQTSAMLATLHVALARETRTVGRKRLPTTVIGLIVHIAEHTQRHLGECIVLCQLLRAVQT